MHFVIVTVPIIEIMVKVKPTLELNLETNADVSTRFKPAVRDQGPLKWVKTSPFVKKIQSKVSLFFSTIVECTCHH